VFLQAPKSASPLKTARIAASWLPVKVILAK
jgi:hypothetical protein